MPTDTRHTATPEDCQLVRLSAAAQFPEFHRRVTQDQLNRWCGRGVRGVKLQSEFIGGRRHVCQAWCREFLGKLNAGPAAPAGPKDEERHRWVRERLAEAGI